MTFVFIILCNKVGLVLKIAGRAKGNCIAIPRNCLGCARYVSSYCLHEVHAKDNVIGQIVVLEHGSKYWSDNTLHGKEFWQGNALQYNFLIRKMRAMNSSHTRTGYGLGVCTFWKGSLIEHCFVGSTIKQNAQGALLM